MNLLGPEAIKAGVPALYDGEHEGKVTASLDVIFTGAAMQRFFSSFETSDELLWTTLGEVAETFDNTFGLPTLMSPFRPDGLDEIPGAEEACEKVAYHFGGHYCFYFKKKFLPALRKAQEYEDPEARLEFLEKFYKEGWFGNPAGSRLLIRFVSTLIHKMEVPEPLSLRLSIVNDEDDSEAASPSIEVGNPEDLALIENMTPDGLR